MKKTVIIAHGLFMNSLVMKPMEKMFETLGYEVINFGYNTLAYGEKTLKKFHHIVNQVSSEELYFVGHSMGGLLIKDYLANYDLPKHIKDSAVVTLGTPHNGSVVAQTFSKSPLKIILGSAPKAGLYNGSNKIKSNPIPIGSIAGNLPFGVNLVMQIFHKIKEPNDGTVLVSEAIDPQSKDFLIKQRTHMSLIYCKETVNDCHHFFQHKIFSKPKKNKIKTI